jgi:hypothetical protein
VAERQLKNKSRKGVLEKTLGKEQIGGGTIKPADAAAVEEVFSSHLIAGSIHHICCVNNENRYQELRSRQAG